MDLGNTPKNILTDDQQAERLLQDAVTKVQADFEIQIRIVAKKLKSKALRLVSDEYDYDVDSIVNQLVRDIKSKLSI